MGKKRLDNAIVSSRVANDHVFSGGQVGWWVRSGYIVVDIDEGNLIKIPIDKTKMSYTMMSGNPINNIVVSIEDMRLFIRKNDKSYFKLLSKLPSSSESFLTVEISYQNVKKKRKRNSNRKQQRHGGRNQHGKALII